MPKFKITYGVGGGFNDADNTEVIEAISQNAAVGVAYEKACETFDNYSLDQYGIDDDADEETVNETREDWIEYSAEPYTGEEAE